MLEVGDGRRFFQIIAASLAGAASSPTLDLIVSDVRMPVCSGLDVLEVFAEDLWLPPLIILTAFADDKTRHRAKALGAVLLDKPVDIGTLRATAMDLICQPSELR